MPHLRFERSDAGVAATTLAILFPAILMLIFIVIQAGIYWHARQWANAGADRAVAVATERDGTVEQGQDAGEAFLEDTGFCGTPTVNHVPDEDATTMTFTVTCSVGGPLGAMVPDVSARSSGPVERFIPETERE